MTQMDWYVLPLATIFVAFNMWFYIFLPSSEAASQTPRIEVRFVCILPSSGPISSIATYEIYLVWLWLWLFF